MAEERRRESSEKRSERGGGKEEEKGSMTVAEAGHKGGTKTAETHSHEFYEEIGHKGGEIGGQKVKRLIEEGKEYEKEHGGSESERSR